MRLQRGRNPGSVVQSEGHQRSIIRCNQWQSEAISAKNQRQSMAIRVVIRGNQCGNQRQSMVAMRGNRWQSVVGQRLLAWSIIEGNQRQSETIRCNQWQSEAIRAKNQRQSDAIRCNQRRSDAISGNPMQSDASGGNHWQSLAAMRGNQRQSVVGKRLSGVNHRWQSDPIRSNQSQSEAMRGNRRQSEAVQGNQW